MSVANELETEKQLKKQKQHPFFDVFRKLTAEESQSEIAKRIGVSGQTVSNWLHQTYIPDITALEKIAEAYGVSADFLLGRRDNPSTDPDINMIHDLTGLTDEAIDYLSRFSSPDTLNKGVIKIINALLTDRKFFKAVSMLCELEAKSELCANALCPANDRGKASLIHEFKSYAAHRLGVLERDIFELSEIYYRSNKKSFAENEKCELLRYKISKQFERVTECFDSRKAAISDYELSEQQLCEMLGIDEEKLIQMRTKK